MVQTTEWSECSRNCGWGVRERVTNNNEVAKKTLKPKKSAEFSGMRDEERNETVPSAPLWCFSQSRNRESLQNEAATAQQNVSWKGARYGADPVRVLRLQIGPEIQTEILRQLQERLLLQTEQDGNHRRWFHVNNPSFINSRAFLDATRMERSRDSRSKWTKSWAASAQINAETVWLLFSGKKLALEFQF